MPASIDDDVGILSLEYLGMQHEVAFIGAADAQHILAERNRLHQHTHAGVSRLDVPYIASDDKRELDRTTRKIT